MRFANVVVALLMAGAFSSADAQKRTRAQLIADLESHEPGVSEAAFEALKKIPGGFSSRRASLVLAQWVENFNDKVESTLHEHGDTLGIADVEGEGAAEADAEVVGVCAAKCSFDDPRVALAVARALDYNDPNAVRVAARQGPSLLKMFLKESYNEGGADSGVTRQTEALGWLGRIALHSNALSAHQTALIDSAFISCIRATCPPGLESPAVESIGDIVEQQKAMASARRVRLHTAVVAATASPDPRTRVDAMQALAKFRDKRDVPLLDRIQSTDQGRGVAEAAAKAIAKIRAAKP